jgi:hypothetical protein
MSDDVKGQDAKSDEGLLSAAARLVGSTLGKLAAKTGLAHGANEPQSPVTKSVTSRKKKSARVKRAAIAKRVSRRDAKSAIKKKRVGPKKTSRAVNKAKP